MSIKDEIDKVQMELYKVFEKNVIEIIPIYKECKSKEELMDKLDGLDLRYTNAYYFYRDLDFDEIPKELERLGIKGGDSNE